MMNIWKSLALLFAGALASVIGGLVFRPPFPLKYLSGLFVAVVILILYGSGAISKIWHSYNLWRRKRHKLIGILSDMGWNLQDTETYTWTHISPEQWKKEIEEQAKKNGVSITVELITTRRNFARYSAILNPYGGVYPERGARNFETLDKILDYVDEGGLFINVADIPGYWAYNPLLKRRLETTRPIYGLLTTPNGKISLLPVRPFELTPFMERLGLRVLNTENNQVSNWNVQFEDEFKTINVNVNLKVHRVVVVERNTKPVIAPKSIEGVGKTTPLFSVNYGDGTLLISLVFLDSQYPQNDKTKEILANVCVKFIKGER